MVVPGAIHFFAAEAAGTMVILIDRRPWIRCAAALRSLAGLVAGNRVKAVVRSPISVFADQAIDIRIFAKLFHTGRKHDQFGIVGKRHTRAIDRFVPEPSAPEFLGVQINDCFVDRLFDHHKICFET